MSFEWPVQHEWLAKVKEEIIDPEQPIIDAHHHLWVLPSETYLLPEILKDTETQTGTGHKIVATVYADCGSFYRPDGPAHLRSVGETEFANGIATQAASGVFGPAKICAAIFSNTDFMSPQVGEALDAHIAAAPARFRGIRPHTVRDPLGALGAYPNAPEDMMVSKPFLNGLREMAKRNLVTDMWGFHHQLGRTAEMARAVPEASIVMDHLSTPLGMDAYKGKEAEVMQEWKKGIDELAKCENVVMKLGGMNMHFNGFDWHKGALPPTSDQLTKAYSPYYLYAIEKFGPSRCLFESNFPMDKRAVSYNVLWNAHKKIVKDFSKSEKQQMFHDTAARVYRINL